MSKDNNVRMPSSGAGLTTFYEESKSKIRIPPTIILMIVALVVVVTTILNSL